MSLSPFQNADFSEIFGKHNEFISTKLNFALYTCVTQKKIKSKAVALLFFPVN